MIFVRWTEVTPSGCTSIARERRGRIVGYLYTGQPSAIVQIDDFLRCVPLERLIVVEDTRRQTKDDMR